MRNEIKLCCAFLSLLFLYINDVELVANVRVLDRLVKFSYSCKFFVFYNLISCSIVNFSQEYF